MPRVSVVITVFDGEAHVRAAIASVLGQTYRDLELIVVDDASRDGTLQVIESFRDPRLVVLESRKNSGPFAAANRALARATGELVARLDADDVALPHRLDRQVSLMDERREVGILGSSVHLIDQRGRRTGFAVVPYHDLAIRWQALLRSPFHHSTVILRRALLEEHQLTYDGTLRIGGDYELWIRTLAATRAANEKAALVKYRLRAGGITGANRPMQQRIQDRISRAAIAAAVPGVKIKSADLRDLRALVVIDRHTQSEASLPLLRRRALAEIYLSMFRTFAEQHERDPYLKALKLQVERRAAAITGAAP